mmetsp:Transcript_34573/g.90204  ORF Transcript_34573/g.90204 Transcript_34573/m.90204 type:complete len:137 (-) Transcript_34573:281-691(-)
MAASAPGTGAVDTQGLAAFREKLLRCAAAYEALEKALTEGDSGLARITEKEKSRFPGEAFGTEDVRQALCSEWLTNKLKDYVRYVDAATNGNLDPVSAPNTPATTTISSSMRSPEQRGSVASEFKSRSAGIKPFSL